MHIHRKAKGIPRSPPPAQNFGAKRITKHYGDSNELSTLLDLYSRNFVKLMTLHLLHNSSISIPKMNFGNLSEITLYGEISSSCCRGICWTTRPPETCFAQESAVTGALIVKRRRYMDRTYFSASFLIRVRPESDFLYQFMLK